MRTARWLQAATGISSLGSRVTELALPLTAVLVLDATGMEVGLLASAVFLPHLLGVAAGPLIEHMRPRRAMLVCDAGRAALIGSIPVAYLLDLLTYAQLVAVGLTVGCLTVVSDLTSASYLPRLVGLDQLVAARSRQMTLMQIADVAGRPLGGILVGAVGAARAVAVDAATYVCSFVLVWRLPEMAPTGGADGGFWTRLKAGAGFAWNNRVNRHITLEAAHYNLFYQAFIVAFLVYTTTEVAWSATAIGLALGSSSAGAIVGSALAPRLSERWGIGPCIVAALVTADVATLMLPVAVGAGAAAVGLVCVNFAVIGAGSLVSGVLAGSLNRMVTSEDIYTRVLGANRVVTRGGTAVGGLLGGLLLGLFDARASLVVCAIGMSTAIGWVLTPRVRSVRTVADATSDAGASR